MDCAEKARDWLCHADAQVSAHYVIAPDGRVWHLVDEADRAWHAGAGAWGPVTDVNSRSIGIEIVNPGHEWGYRDFPAAQVDAVVALLKEIRTRHNIPVSRVLAHSDVAPGRKEDPGEKFPWGGLAAEGLVVAPYGGPSNKSIPYEEALAALRAIGYEVPDVAPGKPAPAAALLAFQRRFCPQSLGQGMDPLTKAALALVAHAF